MREVDAVRQVGRLEEGFGSSRELPGFKEDDASPDFDGVITESSEQGDVDGCLHSVRPLRGLGDGEEAPVQFVHDRVGGDKLLSAFSVDVSQYQLGFGGPGHCCLTHVL